MGEQIRRLCPDVEIIDAIGRTSLKGLLALLDRARVVIAPDSGPVHMANALGTPTLGLYATTNPDRAAPYLWRDHVVNRYPDAVRCYLKKPIEAVNWGTRVRHADAMALITLDDVVEHLDRLIAATSDTAQAESVTEPPHED